MLSLTLEYLHNCAYFVHNRENKANYITLTTHNCPRNTPQAYCQFYTKKEYNKWHTQNIQHIQ